jgi:AcrR family transcriptional regulator
MPSSTRSRRRPRGRREVILSAAADLFIQNGVANTGINDIGAAAGITGPGVYRHFVSKAAILSAIGAQALNEFLPQLRSIAEAGDDPWVTLERIVGNMADSILANRAAVAVMTSERKQFEPRFRARVEKAHRAHMAEWVRNLHVVYPNHSEPDLDRAAHGVYTMVLSLAEQDAAADPDRLRAVYVSMAMAALRNIPEEKQ